MNYYVTAYNYIIILLELHTHGLRNKKKCGGVIALEIYSFDDYLFL